MPEQPNYNKVLVIGIDAMDPKITNKLIAEGKLPNFKKLAEMESFLVSGNLFEYEKIFILTNKLPLKNLSSSDISPIEGYQAKKEIMGKRVTLFTYVKK